MTLPGPGPSVDPHGRCSPEQCCSYARAMRQWGAFAACAIGVVMASALTGCAQPTSAPAPESSGAAGVPGATAAATEAGSPAAEVTVTVTATASSPAPAEPSKSTSSPTAKPTGGPGPTAVKVDWDSGKGTPDNPAPDPSPSGWYEAAFGSSPADQGKVIYLTLDDGPGVSTPDALEVLAANHATATFFVVGSQAAANPNEIAAIKAAGHAVGTHTWDHADLTTLSSSEVQQELNSTAQAAGSGPCMRPPYGSIDAASGAVSEGMKLQPILWTAQAFDWKSTATTAQIVADIEARTSPGAVVLLHDGGGDRSKTVAALKELLPYWKAQGYQLKPVPACL